VSRSTTTPHPHPQRSYKFLHFISFRVSYNITMSFSEQDRGSRDGYVSVLIIGAGASGITMGYHLKNKLGFGGFRVVERQSGVGGISSE
jgi:ribulose 1,5-bisphosphate synthetase/thiazole synthase